MSWMFVHYKKANSLIESDATVRACFYSTLVLIVIKFIEDPIIMWQALILTFDMAIDLGRGYLFAIGLRI